MDKKFIGERITELRLNAQMSEYQLSLNLGKSKSYIQNITSGKAMPSMNGLIAICDYFDISLTSFFAPTDNAKTDNSSILLALNNLNLDSLVETNKFIDLIIDHLKK